MPIDDRDNQVKRVGLFGAERRAMASRSVKVQSAVRQYGPAGLVLIGVVVGVALSVFRCG